MKTNAKHGLKQSNLPAEAFDGTVDILLKLYEAYTDGEIIIENGTLTDFLDLSLMNFGRGDLNFFSYLINRLRGSYRYLTNFNFIKKSKMNVSHHYDISDDLYDLFLDPKRQYSCALFYK